MGADVGTVVLISCPQWHRWREEPDVPGREGKAVSGTEEVVTLCLPPWLSMNSSSRDHYRAFHHFLLSLSNSLTYQPLRSPVLSVQLQASQFTSEPEFPLLEKKSRDLEALTLEA